MRLLAIRDLNQEDPLPPLGPPMKPPKPEPAPTPSPVPVKGNPEILRRPDGKLETDIEANKGIYLPNSDSMVNYDYSKIEARVLARVAEEGINALDAVCDKWAVPSPAPDLTEASIEALGDTFSGPPYEQSEIPIPPAPTPRFPVGSCVRVKLNADKVGASYVKGMLAARGKTVTIESSQYQAGTFYYEVEENIFRWDESDLEPIRRNGGRNWYDSISVGQILVLFSTHWCLERGSQVQVVAKYGFPNVLVALAGAPSRGTYMISSENLG